MLCKIFWNITIDPKKIKETLELNKEEKNALQEALKRGLAEKVINIENVGDKHVYDVTVGKTHSLLTNVSTLEQVVLNFQEA